MSFVTTGEFNVRVANSSIQASFVCNLQLQSPLFLKDTHREKPPSKKTPTHSKSMAQKNKFDAKKVWRRKKMKIRNSSGLLRKTKSSTLKNNCQRQK